MGDPGFLSGLIGWVIGFAMGFIVEQIKIVLSFPEQWEKLKRQQQIALYCRKNSSCSPEVTELLKNVSLLVDSSPAVPAFNVISRYVMCKRMIRLISKLEMNQPFHFFHIRAAGLGMKVPVEKDAKQTEVEGEVPVEKKDAKQTEVEREVLVEKKDAKQTEVEGEVPVEKKAASGKFLSLLGAAAAGALATVGIVLVRNHFNKPTEEEKKPTEEVAVVPEPSLAQTGPTPALPQEPSALTSAEEGAGMVTVDATVPGIPAEPEVASKVSDATGPTPALLKVTVDATPAVQEMPAEPEEASKAPATPGAEEEVLMEEVKSTNRGHLSGFMGILEQMNVDFSGRKHLASLEALAREIRLTITVLKEQINSTSHGNGSAVQEWFKQLEQHLQKADNMINEYKGHFIYNAKTRKRICGLTSDINALLKLGQMIISFECFKKDDNL